MSDNKAQELQDLRDALRRIQYSATSLADAQVISLEALARTHQPEAAQHKQGCDALGGYGHGIGPCSCGAQQPAQVVPEGLGAVLAYTRGGAPGVHGQTCGADGAGDYAVLLHGDATSCDGAARAHIRSLEARGIRVSQCVLVRNEETYSGPAVTLLAASQHGEGDK